MPFNFARRVWLIVSWKKQNLQSINDLRFTINQKGISQIILPLLIIAGIGLSVYLVQQRTNLIPFAADCKLSTEVEGMTAGNVEDKDNTDLNVQKEGQTGSAANGVSKAYIKSRQQWIAPDKRVIIRFVWTDGRVSWDFKEGGSLKDGYAVSRTGCEKVKKSSGNGKQINLADGRLLVKTEFADKTVEYNFFNKGGDPKDGFNYTYDLKDSYSVYCAGKDCPDQTPGGAQTGSSTGNGTTNAGNVTVGSTAAGKACSEGKDCQSGTCTNKVCASTGSKAGGAACENGAECQSNTCTNKKCAGGTKATGLACDTNADCASNKCTANKCVAAVTSNSTNNTTNNTTKNGTPDNTNNNATAGSGSSGATTGAGGTTTTPPATIPTPLTKAEISGFKASYAKLFARLGTAKDKGNLKIVADIANSELASVETKATVCPNDATLNTCLEALRTSFNFAKTAARLSAFYGIFNNVPGICAKADFGLVTLISAPSASGTAGRVNLCDTTTLVKVWRVFVGSFQPLATTETRFPANPTCATLPSDVLEHYRRAESLFTSQTGFVQNSQCDGLTAGTATTTPTGSTNCQGKAADYCATTFGAGSICFEFSHCGPPTSIRRDKGQPCHDPSWPEAIMCKASSCTNEICD